MWPTSPKYQQCPKVKLPRSKIWDSFTWSGFPQGYSPDFIKASLPKYKWTLTSVSWTWNYTGSLFQPTILVRCLPVSNLPVWCLPFLSTVPNHQSHQKFSTATLNYPSAIICLSTINKRAGFIKNSSRKKKTHWIMKWRFASFKFLSPLSHTRFSLWPYHFQHIATNIAS